MGRERRCLCLLDDAKRGPVRRRRGRAHRCLPLLAGLCPAPRAARPPAVARLLRRLDRAPVFRLLAARGAAGPAAPPLPADPVRDRLRQRPPADRRGDRRRDPLSHRLGPAAVDEGHAGDRAAVVRRPARVAVARAGGGRDGGRFGRLLRRRPRRMAAVAGAPRARRRRPARDARLVRAHPAAGSAAGGRGRRDVGCADRPPLDRARRRGPQPADRVAQQPGDPRRVAGARRHVAGPHTRDRIRTRGRFHAMTFGSLWRFLAVALPVLGALLASLSSVDLAYHLRAGAMILDSGAIPTRDTFTFTSAGAPWLDQQWGAQVILATVYRLAGWTGLVVLRAALVGMLFAVVLATCRRAGLNGRVAAWLTLAVFVVTAVALALRPQLFGMLLFALVAYLVVDRRAHPNRLWLVMPIVDVCANLHRSLSLGPLTVELA